MKENQPVKWAGLCTKTNRSMVLHEIFISGGGMIFSR